MNHLCSLRTAGWSGTRPQFPGVDLQECLATQPSVTRSPRRTRSVSVRLEGLPEECDQAPLQGTPRAPAERFRLYVGRGRGVCPLLHTGETSAQRGAVLRSARTAARSLSFTDITSGRARSSKSISTSQTSHSSLPSSRPPRPTQARPAIEGSIAIA